MGPAKPILVSADATASPKRTAPSFLVTKSKESYKDIIQKAQNLTLSQEREQAIQILLRKR